MVSIGSAPWYNRPAREFPAKRWLRERYPFTVSPLIFARLAVYPVGAALGQRRPFPAKRWLEARAGESRPSPTVASEAHGMRNEMLKSSPLIGKAKGVDEAEVTGV
jgi:hypothetical protein